MACTARAHNSKRPSRIDFALSNDAFLPLIQSWSMGPFGMFDVHRVITLGVKVEDPTPRRTLHLPAPIDLSKLEDQSG